jgi:hypothetical protein
MPLPDPESWSDRLVTTLRRYDEALLRKVAGRLVRARNQWPTEDLISRSVETINNPAVLDRRLADLEPAGRQLLALIGHSRQPCWALGNVVEMMMALGQEDGLKPVFDLLEAGLLYPLLAPLPEGADRRVGRIVSFEQWLGTAGVSGLTVFSPPQVAGRAIGVDLGLPDLSVEDQPPSAGDKESEAPSLALRAGSALGAGSVSLSATTESDGLEWLLRLGVLWQQVAGAPLRRTQQGGFFKRDLERLEQDPLLNSPPADQLTPVPDLGFLLAALADQEGILQDTDGELRAAGLPAAWETGLPQSLASLYSALFLVRGWSPLDGWKGAEEMVGNPFPSAYLLALLLLSRLPEEAWVRPWQVEAWLSAQHPYWTNESLRPSRQKPWLERFLLGIAFPLRLVLAAKDSEGAYRVRLSPVGRWLLGLAEMPPLPPVFPRTLLVQPNLEIVAYRQGLTPSLIGRLTRFAAWKTLGAACTLQLEPETVYRALEAGETFDSIRLALEQHGTRAMPPAVLDSLRTWANKRDRITVFPAAALLEFTTPEDLNEALARGLPGIRVADTVAVVPSEDAIEYRHFRLTGTRDYGLPPERCVSVEPDGVTLTVDLARSDLMLEAELSRFAECVDRSAHNGKRAYRLTPSSVARSREAGMSLPTLETWFQQRTGQGVSAAARLLLTGAGSAEVSLRRHLVLHVADEEVADGLMQWPATRELIDERLGPMALSVGDDKVEALRQRLAELGVKVEERMG